MCFYSFNPRIDFLNVGSSGALLDSICYLSGQLHRRFGLVIVGLIGALKFILSSLWTTTPTFKSILSEHLVLYHRLNRRCPSYCIGLTGDRFSLLPALPHRLNRCYLTPCVGSTGELYRAIFVLLFVVASAVDLVCS